MTARRIDDAPAWDNATMGFFITSYNRPIITPCISVCALRDDGLCEGCLRTADEISAWGSMAEMDRQRVMYEVLPERRAREESSSA
jgi:uncharacterized protein